MKRLYSLVMMQLKDRIDLSFAKNVKKLIIKIVLSVLKFSAVAAVSFFVIFACNRFLGLFWPDEVPSVMVFVITFFFVLSVISCTSGLVKTMYFADDNKVLVTLPMSENVVFLSKLLVYYVYEVIRNINLLMPVVVGFILNMAWYDKISPLAIFGMMIPLMIYSAIPVLLGALLSIPVQYIVRFFKRFRFAGYVLFAIVLAALVTGVILLISIIPDSISIPTLYPTVIKPFIQEFLRGFKSRFYPFAQIVNILIGVQMSYGGYAYTWGTFLAFLVMIAIIGVLFGIVFVTTRFLFYNIMRRTFEFEKKKVDDLKANRVHCPATAFLLKEIKLNLRSIENVLNYTSVYVLVPIMIFLMNKIISGINTSVRGDNLAYAFTFLVFLLPLLSSNSLVASAFSKEGRAGYIKKTKPVNIIWPLTSKLVFNLVGSFISVLATVIIIGSFNNFGFVDGVLVFFAVLLLNYAHMIWSATLDLMNPMNDQYATSGSVDSNVNENVSTVVAFIVSLFYAVIAYFLLVESGVGKEIVNSAFLKLCIIGVVAFAASVYMYVLKIKAYYYER